MDQRNETEEKRQRVPEGRDGSPPLLPLGVDHVATGLADTESCDVS